MCNPSIVIPSCDCNLNLMGCLCLSHGSCSLHGFLSSNGCHTGCVTIKAICCSKHKNTRLASAFARLLWSLPHLNIITYRLPQFLLKSCAGPEDQGLQVQFTAEYASPELSSRLRLGKHEGQPVRFKAQDAWCIGCMLVETMTGCSPFYTFVKDWCKLRLKDKLRLVQQKQVRPCACAMSSTILCFVLTSSLMKAACQASSRCTLTQSMHSFTPVLTPKFLNLASCKIPCDSPKPNSASICCVKPYYRVRLCW